MKKHVCQLTNPNINSEIIRNTRPAFNWCKRQWLSMVLVSAKHPFCQHYFRSEVGVRQEKIRQLNSAHPWVIHPLSKFRMIYEMWLCVLYTWAIIQKPSDSAFGFSAVQFPRIEAIWKYTVVCDLFCFIDILISFITGYKVSRNKVVELSLRKIWRHYLTGPFFICDLLSCFPKLAIPETNWIELSRYLRGAINLTLYLKIVRFPLLMKLMGSSNEYLHMEPKVWHTVLKQLIFLALLVHYTGCLSWTISKVTGTYFGLASDRDCWIYQNNIYNSPFSVRYMHAVFRSSSCLFCIRLTNIYTRESFIDMLYRMLLYIVGKIAYVYTIIVISTGILHSRSMDLKYHVLLDELLEYIRVSNIPEKLEERLLTYYKYKYQKKFFKEKLLIDLLPKHLIREVNMYNCKTLLKNVKMLSHFSKEKQMEIVQYLKPEIYLAGDVIIPYGTPAHALYYIVTGTVAVYTRSGKEVCHLEDGAYFGEISLLIKNQMHNSSIIAVEITEVYKLPGKYFLKLLLPEKELFQKIVNHAIRKYEYIKDIETSYRKMLFEEEYSRTLQPTS